MHHQDTPLPDDIRKKLNMTLHGLQEGQGEFLQRQAEELALGATGKFPEGKLTSDDEGEIAFGVTHYKGKIVFNFGKSVMSLGMSIQQARQLRAEIQKHIKAVQKDT